MPYNISKKNLRNHKKTYRYSYRHSHSHRHKSKPIIRTKISKKIKSRIRSRIRSRIKSRIRTRKMQSGGFGTIEAIGIPTGCLAGALLLLLIFARWENKRYEKQKEQENRSWDDDHPSTGYNALALAAAAARAAEDRAAATVAAMLVTAAEAGAGAGAAVRVAITAIKDEKRARAAEAAAWTNLQQAIRAEADERNQGMQNDFVGQAQAAAHHVIQAKATLEQAQETLREASMVKVEAFKGMSKEDIKIVEAHEARDATAKDAVARDDVARDAAARDAAKKADDEAAVERLRARQRRMSEEWNVRRATRALEEKDDRKERRNELDINPYDAKSRPEWKVKMQAGGTPPNIKRLYTIIKPLIIFINALLLFIPKFLAELILKNVVYLMYNTTASYNKTISARILTFITDWPYKKKDERLASTTNLLDFQKDIPSNESTVVTTLSKSFSHLLYSHYDPQKIADILLPTISIKFHKSEATAEWIYPLRTFSDMLEKPKPIKYFAKQFKYFEEKLRLGSVPSFSVIIDPNTIVSKVSTFDFRSEPINIDDVDKGVALATMTKKIIHDADKTTSETSSETSSEIGDKDISETYPVTKTEIPIDDSAYKINNF